MKPVDLVDIALHALPRKVLRLMLAIVILLFGAQAVTWYAEQKTVQVQGVVDEMLKRITTPQVNR